MGEVSGDKSRYVADSIFSYIIQHRLKINDKLPSEEELAELLGVSRSSVREGLRSLKFQGLLQSSPRRGTVLQPVNFSSICHILAYQIAISDVSFYQLLEARRAIELGALELVAARASELRFDEWRELADCSERGEADDALEYICRRDQAFHRKLLELSGNELLISFSRLLELFFTPHRCARRTSTRQTSLEHVMLLDALEAGNLELARGLLKRHLNTWL